MLDSPPLNAGGRYTDVRASLQNRLSKGLLGKVYSIRSFSELVNRRASGGRLAGLKINSQEVDKAGLNAGGCCVDISSGRHI